MRARTTRWAGDVPKNSLGLRISPALWVVDYAAAAIKPVHLPPAGMIRKRLGTPLLAAVALLAALLVVSVSGCELSRGQAAAVDDADDPDAAGGIVEQTERAGLTLHLPTSNDALLRGDGPSFYQALDTTIPGLRPEGWMGGQYGFVRNPAPSQGGMIFTRVHQGVDIRPIYRGLDGSPLDTVRAIDDGLVVYLNDGANASSYGRYVVLSHAWDGSPVYSLMAHLEKIWVEPGQRVAGGEPVGRMGYTGQGLARHRAHLHLEVALMINSSYDAFHSAFHGTHNAHGRFTGLNMRGVDPAQLYLAVQDEPALTFAAFVRNLPVAFQVALPGERPLDLLERYPWLAAEELTRGGAAGGAWLISFTREGVPIEVGRHETQVSGPSVVRVARDVQRRHLSTGGLLARGDSGYHLTRAGLGYMALIATSDGDVPEWF